MVVCRSRRRDPHAMRELECFAERNERRAAELERAQEQLRQQRDEAIMRACGRGVPKTTIAETVGISQQLVSKVIRTRRGEN
jgi:DNA-binding NarL/FixJ family response regulator